MFKSWSTLSLQVAFYRGKCEKTIIGADFFRYYGVLVDINNRRLLNNYTKLITIAPLTTEPTLHYIP